eukprot:2720623-Amphidinium_carterae.1
MQRGSNGKHCLVQQESKASHVPPTPGSLAEYKDLSQFAFINSVALSTNITSSCCYQMLKLQQSVTRHRKAKQ